MTAYRIPRKRYIRHDSADRVEHARYLDGFIDDRATDLDATGTATTISLTADAFGIQATGTFTFSGQPNDADTLTIGDEVYTFGTGGIDISANVVATGTLTASAQPANDDTVTIGSKTYTFKTALSVGPEVANEVLLGADRAASLTNLVAAMTAGAGSGTLFGTGTTANTDATGVAAATTVALTAASPNAGGNSVVTTETSSVLSFGAATLTGGVTATIEATRDNLLTALGDSVLITAAANSTDAVDITTVEYLDLDYATTIDGAYGAWGDPTVTGGADPSHEITWTSHGLSVGDGPFLLTTSGTLPSGLELATFYFIHTVVDANTVILCTAFGTQTNAEITAAGSGTHTATKASSYEAIFEYMKRNNPPAVAAATDVDDL